MYWCCICKSRWVGGRGEEEKSQATAGIQALIKSKSLTSSWNGGCAAWREGQGRPRWAKSDRGLAWGQNESQSHVGGSVAWLGDGGSSDYLTMYTLRIWGCLGAQIIPYRSPGPNNKKITRTYNRTLHISRGTVTGTRIYPRTPRLS